ncbi:hypothetical protein Tco_0488914 [Tanacetum coccineum]
MINVFTVVGMWTNLLVTYDLSMNTWITFGGWPFFSAVLGQMAHLVANITINSARWWQNISPEGFMSSVLLWLVIIIAVVGVGGTVVIVSIVVVVVVESDVLMLPLEFAGFKVRSDGKIRLPSSGLQFGDNISLSKVLEFNPGGSIKSGDCIIPVFAMLATCASTSCGNTVATSFLMAS